VPLASDPQTLFRRHVGPLRDDGLDEGSSGLFPFLNKSPREDKLSRGSTLPPNQSGAVVRIERRGYGNKLRQTDEVIN